MYLEFRLLGFFSDDNIDITFPRVNRLLLILPVSFAISPYDLLSFSLSLPARSTNEIFPYFLNIWPSSWDTVSLIRYTVKIECEREESLLSSWLPDFLFFMPSCKTALRSYWLVHSTTIKSSTKKPFFTFHLQCKMPEEGFRRSRSCSL